MHSVTNKPLCLPHACRIIKLWLNNGTAQCESEEVSNRTAKLTASENYIYSAHYKTNYWFFFFTLLPACVSLLAAHTHTHTLLINAEVFPAFLSVSSLSVLPRRKRRRPFLTITASSQSTWLQPPRFIPIWCRPLNTRAITLFWPSTSPSHRAPAACHWGIATREGELLWLYDRKDEKVAWFCLVSQCMAYMFGTDWFHRFFIFYFFYLWSNSDIPSSYLRNKVLG